MKTPTPEVRAGRDVKLWRAYRRDGVIGAVATTVDDHGHPKRIIAQSSSWYALAAFPGRRRPMINRSAWESVVKQLGGDLPRLKHSDFAGTILLPLNKLGRLSLPRLVAYIRADAFAVVPYCDENLATLHALKRPATPAYLAAFKKFEAHSAVAA